ncbi:hypothetical protein D3C76_1163550 [compost metagenome]
MVVQKGSHRIQPVMNTANIADHIVADNYLTRIVINLTMYGRCHVLSISHNPAGENADADGFAIELNKVRCQTCDPMVSQHVGQKITDVGARLKANHVILQ